MATKKVVAMIAEATGDEDLGLILKTARGSVISEVKCTIRSHKDPGFVVPRLIHACVDHQYTALGRWVALQYDPRLIHIDMYLMTPEACYSVLLVRKFVAATYW